jgi:branched-chain amino acid transport system substrate-binding protein
VTIFSKQDAGGTAGPTTKGWLGRRTRQTAAIASVAALGVALLSACGSSSKSSTATTASGASSGTTSATGGSTGAASGGTTATGSPILIGVSLVDEGPLAAKGMPQGISGGIYYVNHVLGGVNGHPLKVVMCNSDLTPATEVNCANNFVSKGVVAVDDSFDAGFTAQLPILQRAGIPIFGVEVADAEDDHAPNAYFFGPPNEAFSVGPLQVFKNEGYTKLHLSIANVPSAVVYVNDDVDPVAKELGMKVETTYFDEATVNWSVVANSMLSDNPQMVGEISTTEQDCDSLLPAVRNTGFKGPILMAGCSQYVQQNPSEAINTFSYGDSWTPYLAATAPAAVQTQIKAYNAAETASGNPDTTAYGQLGVMGFAAFPDLQYALSAQKTGAFTTASVNTDLHNVSNFQSFLGPVDTCDHTQWPGTSSCNHQVLMLKVVKNASGSGDTWQSVPSGGFVQVNASLLQVKS